MFLAKKYRGFRIGQQMLDTALDSAKRMSYTRILLYSSRELEASRRLYLKNRFVDIPRYNNDDRADVVDISDQVREYGLEAIEDIRGQS
jgi:GNAT superfamily N-acetyltransferase